MIKFATALIPALAAGWMLAGSATSADAGYGYSGCCGGGPLPPTYHYKTKPVHHFKTRYLDRNVYRHVPRLHRVVYVTRVQPIIHTHLVTRVHHHTVFYTQNTYQHATQYLPPIHYTSGSTKNYYDCSCQSHY